MIELVYKIKGELTTLTELYDYYLEKLDKEPYNQIYTSRINELRVQIDTYQKVLDMIRDGSDKE